jgi:hypothetical protein
MVRLNNRDFVEFLLFRLATEARDDHSSVRAFMLCDNEIQSIDPWSPVLHFCRTFGRSTGRATPRELLQLSP